MSFYRNRSSAIVETFANRNFAVFTVGNSISLVGMWVQRLAVGWLAWELTGSGFWLGAVAFADLFPVVIIGPFAGVLADRLDRRMILVVCKALAALQSTLLTILTVAGWMTIEILFGLSLFLGIVIGVQQAARLAIVPSLVDVQQLGSAVAINSVIFNLARFAGPALAGLLITGPGVAVAFAFGAFAQGVIIIALLYISPPPQETSIRRGVVAEFLDGTRYAFSHPAIMPLLLMSTVSALLARPVFELLPGFADEVFGRGAGGLAALTSAVGLGAISSGLWLAQRGGLQGLTILTFVGFGLSGVLSALFAVTSVFWLGVVIMVMSGCAMVISGAGSQTLIQTTVAGHMRGRVLGLWVIVFRGGPAIGALGMGWLAEAFGFAWPVAIGGALCALAVVLPLRDRRRLIPLLEMSASSASQETAAKAKPLPQP
jgi:MFS family permease